MNDPNPNSALIEVAAQAIAWAEGLDNWRNPGKLYEKAAIEFMDARYGA